MGCGWDGWVVDGLGKYQWQKEQTGSKGHIVVDGHLGLQSDEV